MLVLAIVATVIGSLALSLAIQTSIQLWAGRPRLDIKDKISYEMEKSEEIWIQCEVRNLPVTNPILRFLRISRSPVSVRAELEINAQDGTLVSAKETVPLAYGSGLAFVELMARGGAEELLQPRTLVPGDRPAWFLLARRGVKESGPAYLSRSSGGQIPLPIARYLCEVRLHTGDGETISDSSFVVSNDQGQLVMSCPRFVTPWAACSRGRSPCASPQLPPRCS